MGPQPQPTRRNPNHTMGNTVLLMITQELTSMLKKPLTARLSLDHTKSTFPMAVSKLSPTLLTTTTVSSLMSNTKVPQYTQKLSHTTQLPSQLTTPPHTTQPQPQPMPKKSVQQLFLV